MKNTHKLYIDVIAKSGGGENFLQEIINNTKSASFIFPRYKEAYTKTYWAPDDITVNQYTQEFVDNLIKNIDLSLCTNFKYFMYNCKGFSKLPNIYSGKSTNFDYAFYGTELEEITFIDTSSATSMESMFGQCKKLTTIKQLDTSNATYIFGMFGGCESLISIPPLDVSKSTSMSNIFMGCTSLTSIGMYGFTRSIDISPTALEHDAIVAFLNQAGTAYDSSQKITMGSAKLALLNDEEKAIATNKGWTLA